MADTESFYYPSSAAGSLRQGEILSNIVYLQVKPSDVDSATKQFDPVIYNYTVVLSQDCDLNADYESRHPPKGKTVAETQRLLSVLLCTLIPVEDLKKRAREGSDSILKKVLDNTHPRYHVLQQVLQKEDAEAEGIKALGMDFRHYFSMDTEELYARLERKQSKRRCCMHSPYFEHLTNRFVGYFGRVGLPTPHSMEGM